MLHIIRSQNKQKIKTGGFYTIVDYPYSQWCKTQHFITAAMVLSWKALRKAALNSKCAQNVMVYFFIITHESGGMMVQRIKVVRKHQRKSKIDDNRTLMQIGARASKQAIKEALDSGVSIAYIKDGWLVSQAPDGTLSEIKAVDGQPPIKLRELLCRA
ncbi:MULTISPECIES: hypothetical protein [Pectobacterium]|uniref:Uncharacterized protein n=2 Tax=Pectobacterium TaxID=122277 RepID=A0AA93DMK4_9GAMM|nr:MULTISPECIES: hypothetical protein [Pectobacterium]MBA0157804.1 hypothetical protein [Pectobacterium versatile]MBA0163895.1 hypothetical protein [Pectobacterium versatile]MBA0170819.1 hypothetical protein [Pectobacterium versatile]MBN3060371.1 hypothetical protein [Pectobacterium versatile]MBN3236345.1 hypothetical protein [Pectobacterium versatile]